MLKTSLIAALLLSTAPAFSDPLTANGIPQVGTVTSPLINTDDERAAFKSGRMFIFATGNNGVPANPGIQVATNSFLNVRICNASTTRTWYIAPFGRFLDTSSQALTAYGGVSNPDALTTTTAATLTGCGAVSPNTCNLTYGTNLAGNGLAQTDVSMSFGVGSMMTVASAAAVPSGTGIIYPSMKNEISKPRGLPPGKCFGQYLVGQNTTNALGGTGTAIYLGLRVYMYYDQ